jgi:hypothetical protein
MAADERWGNLYLYGCTACEFPVIAINPVGAGLLAMDVNDNAGYLNDRGALESIASKLAPTG